MDRPPVSRIVLQPEPGEERLEEGRPNVRRYRLARLEEVASDSLGAIPSDRTAGELEQGDQSPLNK